VNPITIKHIRFLCEVHEDPTKEIKLVSATRLRTYMDLKACALVEESENGFVILTPFGDRILNVLRAELHNYVSTYRG
jgi:hypothetical protein